MHLPLVDHWFQEWPLRRWAAASRQRSRSNAMVAATALTQRRAEARLVEEYLASTGRPPGAEAPDRTVAQDRAVAAP